MKLISEAYKKDNEQLHHDCADYGGGGSRRIKQVCDVIDGFDLIRILDYGSGKGDLTKKLCDIYPNKDIIEYDPCIKGKTVIPNNPFDLVICNDVMEHVEMECLWNVLSHLKELTDKVCFFCIGLKLANKTLPDGRNTHITILSKETWLNIIKGYFYIEDTYMIGSGKLCMVCTPKKE